MSRVIENPGSPEAIKKGCKCPRMDNANGKGLGNGLFWYSGDCGYHQQYPIVSKDSPAQPPHKKGK